MSAEAGGGWAPPLRDLQAWLQLEIAHPTDGGALPPPETHPAADQVVRSTEALPAAKRVGIYQTAYFLRLRGVLAADYPAVYDLLGDAEFDSLCRGYLAAYPSRRFTLNPLGWKLPQYLAEIPDGVVPSRALVRDVARLECAMAQVFDAAPSVSIDPDVLTAVPREAWPGARFRFIEGLRALAFDHRANAIVSAVRKGLDEHPPYTPERTWCAVYRQSFQIWRCNLSEARYVLLEALMAGETLGDALCACAEVHEGPGLETDVFHWLADWVGDGLFTAVEV